tara:strand:+ start:1984 stop:3003 length:1020 start_codon:yes stop_codon:yes gene_type:complete
MDSLTKTVEEETSQEYSLGYALQVRKAIIDVQEKLRKDSIVCSAKLSDSDGEIEETPLEEFVETVKLGYGDIIDLGITDRFSMFYVEISTKEPSFVFEDFTFDERGDIGEEVLYDNLVEILEKYITNQPPEKETNPWGDEFKDLDEELSEILGETQIQPDIDPEEFKYLAEEILASKDIQQNLVLKDKIKEVSHETEGEALKYLQSENGLYDAIEFRYAFKKQALDNFEANIAKIVCYVRELSPIDDALKKGMRDIKEDLDPELFQAYSFAIHELNDGYASLVSKVSSVINVLYSKNPEFSLFKEENLRDYKNLNQDLRTSIQEEFTDLKARLEERGVK